MTHSQTVTRVILERAMKIKGKAATVQVLVARYNVAIADYQAICVANRSGYETPESIAAYTVIQAIVSEIGGNPAVKFNGAHNGEFAGASYAPSKPVKKGHYTAAERFAQWQRSEA